MGSMPTRILLTPTSLGEFAALGLPYTCMTFAQMEGGGSKIAPNLRTNS